MATAITFDRPGFIGQVLQRGGQIVCVLSPAAATDRAIQAHVRQLTRSQGIDCRNCRDCPVGQAD